MLRPPRLEDYIEIVEVIEEKEDTLNNLDVPAANSQGVLAELNGVWEKVVGSPIAEMTRVVGSYGYSLTVEVPHFVYATELNLVMDRILEKIRVELRELDPPLCKLDLRNGVRFRVNSNLGCQYLEVPV